MDYLIQQLEAGKSETLTGYLGAMARFHSYSFGNILQIARQRPTATRVAGIRAWNELGRFARKGEKGIQILVPIIGYRRRRDAAQQEEEAKPASVLIGFRAVYGSKDYLAICGRDSTRSIGRASRCSERTLDSTSYIIDQLSGLAQRCFRGSFRHFVHTNTWFPSVVES